MKAKYKLLALVPLVMIMGCKKYEHRNVIKEIGEIEKQKTFVLQDVETGTERIYSYYRTDWPDYLRIGDTVTLVVGNSYNTTEKSYYRNRVFHPGDCGLKYSMDSIYARMEREKFNDMKQKMQKTR